MIVPTVPPYMGSNTSRLTTWNWTFGDGGTSTAQNPTHAYSAGRTYSVGLTETDDDGSTGTISQSVTVPAPVSGTVTINSLTGSRTTINKNFWKATVTATISPIKSGAVITGKWSNGNTFSCTTDVAGQCSASQTLSTKSISSITLTITNVVLSGYEYVPGVTTITLTRP